MADNMENDKKAARLKLRKGFIILGAAAVIIAAAALFVSGAFLGKPDKVLRAAYKSCKENGLAEVFSDKTAEYTADLELSVEGVDLSAKLASAEKKKEITCSVGSLGISMEGTALLDEKNLRVKMPILGDTIFVYDYRQENNGYIVELLEENGISQKQWNKALADAVSDENITMNREEGVRLFLNTFRSLSFDTAEKKTVKVNGKERSCKGYRAAITSENMRLILDAIEEIQGEGYHIWTDRILKMLDSDYETFLRELMQQEIIYVTFYIDRNRLVEAAVENAECTVMNLYFAEREMLSVNVNAFSLGDKTCTGSIKLTEGADIKDISGEQIDIGNASEKDILGIVYTSLFH